MLAITNALMSLIMAHLIDFFPNDSKYFWLFFMQHIFNKWIDIFFPKADRSDFLPIPRARWSKT